MSSVGFVFGLLRSVRIGRLGYTITAMPGSLPGPAGAATIVKNEAVKEFLVRQIESALGPHDRLPTERELAERFGISRMTVRRALDRLELEGRVYRVQGAGTFVAPTSVTKTFALTSFTEDMRNRGMEPDSVIIKSGLVPAGARVGHHLGISPGEEVVRLERLRTADGVPMCLERVYLPAHLVPGILQEDLERSLYELLDTRYRIRVEEAEQSVRSTVLQPREARLLEVPALSPALLVERTTFDRRDRRVERATSIYRGDRYSYQLRVRRGDSEQAR